MKRRFKNFLFVTIFGYAMYLSAGPSISMLGGLLVSPDNSDYDAVVKLYFNVGRCSGVFISNRHILTAAHCVDKLHPEKSHLILYTNYRGLSNNVHIDSINIHPGYISYPNETSSKSYRKRFRKNHLELSSVDVAVITLSDPQDVSVLPIAAEVLSENSRVIVTGYNNPKDRQPVGNSQLRVAERRVDRMVSAVGIVRWKENGRHKAKSLIRPGDSGSPVLVSTTEGLSIVGVIGSGKGYKKGLIGTLRRVFNNSDSTFTLLRRADHPDEIVDWIRELVSAQPPFSN